MREKGLAMRLDGSIRAGEEKHRVGARSSARRPEETRKGKLSELPCHRCNVRSALLADVDDYSASSGLHIGLDRHEALLSFWLLLNLLQAPRSLSTETETLTALDRQRLSGRAGGQHLSSQLFETRGQGAFLFRWAEEGQAAAAAGAAGLASPGAQGASAVSMRLSSSGVEIPSARRRRKLHSRLISSPTRRKVARLPAPAPVRPPTRRSRGTAP